jgi:predicted HTH domain antitoxin
MKTKSIRISKDLVEAIDLVEREEKIEESTAMRKLIRIGFETYVGNLYREGKITLRRASRLLHRNQVEVLDLFMDAGIKGNLDASDVLASMDRFLKR